MDRYTWRLFQNYGTKFPVSVLNMHQPDTLILQSFFCHHVPQATASCRLLREGKSEIHANIAHSFDMSLFLYEGKARGYELIASKKNDLELKLKEGNYPRLCPSEAMNSHLLNISLYFEKLITPPSFSESSHGLSACEAEFQIASKTKLCNIDAKSVWEDNTSLNWTSFFVHTAN